jgi:D-alanyl-D-alanine carboxypeptidase (penicillin-binding protein 5/6)
MGTERSVALVAAQDMKVLLPHGWRNGTQLALDYNAPLVAPITQGQVVGHITVSLPGGKQAQVPVEAASSVAALGLLGRAARRLHL